MTEEKKHKKVKRFICVETTYLCDKCGAENITFDKSKPERCLQCGHRTMKKTGQIIIDHTMVISSVKL